MSEETDPATPQDPIPEQIEPADQPSPVVPDRSRVQRYSPDRLLRDPISVPGDVTVSAERRNGRLMVRIESAHDGYPPQPGFTPHST